MAVEKLASAMQLTNTKQQRKLREMRNTVRIRVIGHEPRSRNLPCHWLYGQLHACVFALDREREKAASRRVRSSLSLGSTALIVSIFCLLSCVYVSPNAFRCTLNSLSLRSASFHSINVSESRVHKITRAIILEHFYKLKNTKIVTLKK